MLNLPDTLTIAILRGQDADVAADLARRCWKAGIDLVEVPVQDDRGWRSLEAVLAVAGDLPVGAGSVLTPKDATRALDLGARALISPGLSLDVVECARVNGVLHLPGVMTPSEITTALRAGVTTMKLFPAATLGSGYIQDLVGPFPSLRLVAVGGVGVENAVAFLEAGAVGVAFGSALSEVLESDLLGELKRRVPPLHQSP
jgi:2-dehydro-3-deoxyphosphogluconate aldolase/(4S)-4-hydroxy-2-oxoglutarate aldolase